MKVTQKSAILDYLRNGLWYLNCDSCIGFLMSTNIWFDTSITSVTLFSTKLPKMSKFGHLGLFRKRFEIFEFWLLQWIPHVKKHTDWHFNHLSITIKYQVAEVGHKSTILDYLGNGLTYFDSDCCNELLMPENVGFNTSVTLLAIFSTKLSKVGQNVSHLGLSRQRLEIFQF